MVGLRAGSGEAVQGLFPLFFVLFFLSSQALPRPLIEQDWFRTIATWNPVSYMVEGMRSLIITGWDGDGAVARLRGRDRALRARHLRRLARAADAAGADMSRFIDRRPRRRLAPDPQLHDNPAFLLPSIIFPLFFFTAFAGGLSSVGNVPGFDFPSGYTAFQFVFVLLQSAAFGGVFTGFARRGRLRARLRAPADARGAEPARRSSPATCSPGWSAR